MHEISELVSCSTERLDMSYGFHARMVLSREAE